MANLNINQKQLYNWTLCNLINAVCETGFILSSSKGKKE